MSDIEVQDDAGVRIIRFNRPKKRNALNIHMYQQLTEYLIEGEADNKINAFLLCGSHQCFTSGNDIADFLEHTNLNSNHPTVRFLFFLLELKKPIVAAVSGPAIGIGTTLLLHCDLIYADMTAKFQLPFVDLSLVPEAGSSLLLPQLIGHPKAAELLLLGDPFDAKTALDLKLINDIIDEQKLENYALEKAKRLARKPAEALQLTRQLMRKNKHKLQHQMYMELEHFEKQLNSEDAKKHFKSFLKAK